jgi:hypothetical protein
MLPQCNGGKTSLRVGGRPRAIEACFSVRCTSPVRVACLASAATESAVRGVKKLLLSEDAGPGNLFGFERRGTASAPAL